MLPRESPLPEPAGTRTRSTVVGETMFTVSAGAFGPGSGGASAFGKLTGDAAATRLSVALRQQLATGCRFIQVDLSELSMIDHAGFDVLVDAHQRFLAAGGALVLTGIGPRIMRLLEITGLDRTLFTIPRTSKPPSAQVNRALIDRAIGVVMGRSRCGLTEAVEQVAMLGRATNRTLDEVAQSILDDPTRLRPARHPMRVAHGAADGQATEPYPSRTERSGTDRTNPSERERNSHGCTR
jgi:anti-anti-sigma factor